MQVLLRAQTATGNCGMFSQMGYATTQQRRSSEYVDELKQDRRVELFLMNKGIVPRFSFIYYPLKVVCIHKDWKYGKFVHPQS